MFNPPYAEGITFLRLGVSPPVEVFAGEETAASRRIVLQEELELRLVLRGRVHVDLNQSGLAAGVGTVLCLPPRQLHALSAGAAGCSFIAFQFNDYASSCCAGDGPFTAARAVACIDVPAAVVASGRAAQMQIAGSAATLRTHSESLVRMLDDLMARVSAAPVRPAASGASTRVASIQRALLYLRAHCMREVALQELAAAAGLSKFHFVRLFSTVVGITPHRYQLLLRIGGARTLLRQGAEIADVAQHTGFFDQSHFTACFRDVVGVTPGRYQLQ
jgi:AraC-like DNA-binding protein